MAPMPPHFPHDAEFAPLSRRSDPVDGHWRDNATPEGYIVESWGEGLLVGALMVMACITVANMRKGVLLHKLILLEVRQTTQSPSSWSSTDRYSYYLL